MSSKHYLLILRQLVLLSAATGAGNRTVLVSQSALYQSCGLSDSAALQPIQRLHNAGWLNRTTETSGSRIKAFVSVTAR